MERLVGAVKSYIGNMRMLDVALLKVCVCAVGVMWGMVIPKRSRKVAAALSTGIFSVTYVLLMIPFLKALGKDEQV